LAGNTQGATPISLVAFPSLKLAAIRVPSLPKGVGESGEPRPANPWEIRVTSRIAADAPDLNEGSRAASRGLPTAIGA
jgi:hypothetical protein